MLSLAKGGWHLRAALLCAGLCSLCGCRYNFVPVVPAQAAVNPLGVTLPVRITDARLQRTGLGLDVYANVLTPRSGYLSVVWYDQDSELGRDSLYIESEAGRSQTQAAATQVHFAWPLSSQVGPRGASQSAAQAKTGGPYRAMLLFEGQLLREVDETSRKP